MNKNKKVKFFVYGFLINKAKKHLSENGRSISDLEEGAYLRDWAYIRNSNIREERGSIIDGYILSTDDINWAGLENNIGNLYSYHKKLVNIKRKDGKEDTAFVYYYPEEYD